MIKDAALLSGIITVREGCSFDENIYEKDIFSPDCGLAVAVILREPPFHDR